MAEIVTICWLRPHGSSVRFADVVEAGLSESWQTRDVVGPFDDAGQCRYTTARDTSSATGSLDTVLEALNESDYGELWLQSNGLDFILNKNPYVDRFDEFDALRVSVSESAFRRVNERSKPTNVESLVSVAELISTVLGEDTYGFGTWGAFRDESVPASAALCGEVIEQLFWFNLLPAPIQSSFERLLPTDNLWRIKELDNGTLLVVTCDDPRERKDSQGMTSREATEQLQRSTR